jgi:ABC-type branched-subunit amino acid transport system ATPase component
VSSVTFSVRRGEVVGLIGPNGAGKTTLVNAMSGFAPISEGSITLGGAEISHLPPERRAHRGLARTFQHGRLFMDLSARENIELGALAVGCSAREARRRTDALLEETGLLSLAARPPAELSHGDQQRVSVARAVVAGPAFLLLDEPAAGLPAESLAELRALVEQTRVGRDAGVVVIDHNVEFVLDLSDRVVVLDHGQLLAEGTPSYVRHHEEVLAAYFGSVPSTRSASAAPPGDGDAASGTAKAPRWAQNPQR